ncbi:MAG: LysR substrate-binding domain-containing protein [Albidovulum sp.]|nr:LysR substrate-binding domain-containing protein [Albidovulum sp.]
MASSINVRQIEVFKAVMECRTTVAASQRLNVSQPTVSEHLAALERATSLKLFDRKKNRLMPTPVAEAFHSEIARVYLGVDHLQRFVEGLKHDFLGQIDLGTMPMASYRWMPEIIAKFLENHLVGSISMPVRSSRQILEWVAADRLDFGINFDVRRYPNVATEELMRIPLVCLFPKESGLSQKDIIELRDLDGKTIVQLRSFDIWNVSSERILERPDRIKPKNLVETYVTQTAAQLAKSCRGYALVDIMSALEIMDETMAWRPFEGDEAFSVHLSRSATRRHSAQAEALMDLIREDAKRKDRRFRDLIAN